MVLAWRLDAISQGPRQPSPTCPHKVVERIQGLKMLLASLENTTQTMTCPSGNWKDSRAIINATLTIAGLRYPFTLCTSHVSHHHGLVRFKVSDRKLVKHTTEMILWSMILIIIGLFPAFINFQNICTWPENFLSFKLKFFTTKP